MASPTTEKPASTPSQAATHGMGTSPASMRAPGDTPPAPAAKALDPVLAEGIDPVLLHRLYPEADTIADAGAMALEQGKKTAAEGALIEAAQQAKPEFVR